MNLTLLGGVGSLALSVVVATVSLLSMRVRRSDKKALDAREAAELGIVMLRWSTSVRRLAASEGWDQHPGWPPLPEEATPGYLRGKASVSDNDELLKIVETVTKLAKGDAK